MTSPSAIDSPPAASRAPCSRSCVVPLGLLACAASLALYALPIARPLLIVDDFQIIFRSWTWPAAWANLWVPANEHFMPLGRLSTAALATLAGGRPTVFLTLSGWHGPIALVLGMVLVGFFVGRQRGHPFYGLLAMTLFGVSTVYQQAVYWFSASFSILALDTFLLALLAAQHAIQTHRRWPLALSFLACALAPAWFASGILAGPLCSLYLFFALTERHKILEGGDPSGTLLGRLILRLLWSLVPLLGSLAFLAISLPLTADKVMHLEHYGDETAFQAFHPATGLVYTCRSVVDNLAWGTIGVSELMCPTPWVWIPFAVLLASAAFWIWRAPRKSLPVLGVGVIVLSYWLVYSARAEWGYDLLMCKANWSRYHLLPQLGLALLLVGGLPRLGRVTAVDSRLAFSRRQGFAVLLLIGALFVLQVPRGVLAHVALSRNADLRENAFAYPLPNGVFAHFQSAEIRADQMHAFRRIEAVDALCREHHISAADARRVLDPIRMTYDAAAEPQNESNWQFLHGSDDPREHSDEEIRRVLQPADPN